MNIRKIIKALNSMFVVILFTSISLLNTGDVKAQSALTETSTAVIIDELVHAQSTIVQCSNTAQLIGIANDHIQIEVEAGSIPAWVDARAVSVFPFYNLEGIISTYIMSVERNGQTLGYIVVDATRCNVIEYSTGNLPQIHSLEQAKTIADQWGLSIDQLQPIYLGPFDKFFVLHPEALSLNSSLDYQVLLNMMDFSYILLDDSGSRLDTLPNGAVLQPPKLDANWMATQSATTPSYSEVITTTLLKQLDVPSGIPYLQKMYPGTTGGMCYIGCTPNAGATLLGYWAQHGYPNVYWGLNGDNIPYSTIRLHDAAGTYCVGDLGYTYFDKLSPALTTVFHERGYPGSSSQYITSPSFDIFRAEIDQGRPVVANFNGYYGGGWDGPAHSTSGIGYDTASGNFMIVNPNLNQSHSPVYVLHGSGYSSLWINTLIPPDNQSPAITIIQQPTSNQWYNTDEIISWTISDSYSGVRGYKYSWDVNPPVGTEISGATGSVSSPQGIHTLYIQAWDNAGNASDIASAGPFWFDNIVPISSPTISTGIAGENGWYFSAVNVSLLATDNSGGSGVSQTQYKIDAGNWQTYSAPFSVSTDGFHRVYYKSQDLAGNWETEKNTLVKIDSISPTGSFFIQNGSPQTYSTTTVLNSQASDAASGVSSVRFRDMGGAWSVWFPYPGVVPWQLIGSHGQTASVEAQFKDGAGNVSIVVSDSVTINLYPANPSSTLYVLKRSTFGAVGMSSDSPQYILNGTAGQPSIPGVMQGTNYRLSSGYWASSIKTLPIFTDVPALYWAWGYIERLYNAGVTGGCATSPLRYCPETNVTRGQMAVFLLKGMYGKEYVAPDAVGTVFNDVPASNGFAKWIEQLAAEGITGGCGSGNYCPNGPVTREQMAVFLLVAEHGTGYTPPAATGVFADVPASDPYARWIEQLAMEGITGGCGGGNYCPKQVVTRAQMAVFLVKAFHLP